MHSDRGSQLVSAAGGLDPVEEEDTMVYMDTYWLRKEFTGAFIPWKTYWFAITGIRGPGIQTIAYRDT